MTSTWLSMTPLLRGNLSSPDFYFFYFFLGRQRLPWAKRAGQKSREGIPSFSSAFPVRYLC